jgi:hypothetical protein
MLVKQARRDIALIDAGKWKPHDIRAPWLTSGHLNLVDRYLSVQSIIRRRGPRRSPRHLLLG